MLWTVVTPCAATWRIAASSARSFSASSGGGTFAATRDIALSLKTPVSSRFASPDDLSARDIRRLARHPGGAQRGRVGQRHVAVEPVDPDGWSGVAAAAF